MRDCFNLKFNLEIEKALRFLVKKTPLSNKKSRKPILFHNIRVGTYLYEKQYSLDIVLAGYLHDLLEWTNTTQKEISNLFGKKITKIVTANSKNKKIKNKVLVLEDLIKRCVIIGEKALIVKSADIIDSFRWYEKQNNPEQLIYCYNNAFLILKFKPKKFKDPIFQELKKWKNKYQSLI